MLDKTSEPDPDENADARLRPSMDFGSAATFLAESGFGPASLAEQDLFIPLIHWDRLSAAALTRDGAVLAAAHGFPVADKLEIPPLKSAGTIAPRIMRGVQRSGATFLYAVADISLREKWSLPESLRLILETPGTACFAISAALVRSSDAVREAGMLLGLTPLQCRIIAALVQHGDLGTAAADCAVAYSTAREAVADAMKRVGAPKRSALVERVVRLAFGVPPPGSNGEDLLRDAFGFTSRQLALAAAVASGASREEAASSAGVSAAVAKKELSNIFLSFGVSSGAELSAMFAEASALATLAAASGGDIAAPADRIEPTMIMTRPGAGGSIAFSDYGPKRGEPVLILHSSSASRPAPTKLVSALQERGFRPFAIDRPGFGLTDWLDREGDPFANACEDVRTVCRRLRFDRIDVVARGGAQTALHLASQSPELVGSVVLVAPDPPSRISKPTKGPLGVVKAAFKSNPAFIEPLTRALVANLRTSHIRDLLLKTVSTSPIDLKVMEDPRNVADYCRGYRMFMAGRIKGYVEEQSALVVEPDPPGDAHATWDILIGVEDPLHDSRETAAYFRGLLPSARVTMLPDAGRFVVLTHTALIVERLVAQRASAPKILTEANPTC